MKPERMKEVSRLYRRERDEMEETLTMALCETYQGITGKVASDKLREAIADAIRYEAA